MKEKCIDCEYSRQCFTMKQINSECCLKDRKNEKKDEIKEILQLIGDCCYYGKISVDKCEKYSNYITNLQTIEQQYSAILSENAELENKITNLQEQLHQASLDIQELTEKDIGCPSWCDKLTNLQEENKRLKQYKEDTFLYDFEELQDKVINLQKENNELIELNNIRVKEHNHIYNYMKDYKSRNKKAIEFLEHFDSGQQCEHTKDLVIIVKNILKGEDKEC